MFYIDRKSSTMTDISSQHNVDISLYIITRVQVYLSEEEFQKVFNITVHEFKAMPKWKQNDLKKGVGLF